MNPKIQALYGLKFHPFRPDVPIEALHTTATIDVFLRRVELGIPTVASSRSSATPGRARASRCACSPIGCVAFRTSSSG